MAVWKAFKENWWVVALIALAAIIGWMYVFATTWEREANEMIEKAQGLFFAIRI